MESSLRFLWSTTQPFSRLKTVQAKHTELAQRVVKSPVLRDHQRPLYRTGDGFGNDGSHPGAGATCHPLGRNMTIIPQHLRNAAHDPCAPHTVLVRVSQSIPALHLQSRHTFFITVSQSTQFHAIAYYPTHYTECSFSCVRSHCVPHRVVRVFMYRQYIALRAFPYLSSISDGSGSI